MGQQSVICWNYLSLFRDYGLYHHSAHSDTFYFHFFYMLSDWVEILQDFSKKILKTVFPRIVSAETILFWIWPYVLWPLTFTSYIWIVAAETIQGRKLFKGGNYSRKYGTWKRAPSNFAFQACKGFIFHRNPK